MVNCGLGVLECMEKLAKENSKIAYYPKKLKLISIKNILLLMIFMCRINKVFLIFNIESTIKEISLGGHHSLLLSNKGIVYACGYA